MQYFHDDETLVMNATAMSNTHRRLQITPAWTALFLERRDDVLMKMYKGSI
jgi:hypothetical protein